MPPDLPKTASVARPGAGDRLIAAAATRNAGPICDLLATVAPASGAALELASGTGQHIARFAARLPGLSWQPSEIDATRRASIDAYAADTRLGNIAPAIALNATVPGWSARHPGQALVVLVNLLHLITDADTRILIHEAATALATGARLVIYGPFLRAGELTSQGDLDFHTSLTAMNPKIGYKDDFDVIDLMQNAGLDLLQVIEMPANNLALVAAKPAA